MNLIDLVDNSRTDKNTGHSYLDTYEKILTKIRFTATNVLEIGIGPFKDVNNIYGAPGNGGSIKLWSDYFPNATVYTADIF